MPEPLKYLGKLGKDLPILKSKDWKNIFSFLDFFMVTDELTEKNISDIEGPVFNWSKVKEVLELLGKIDD